MRYAYPVVLTEAADGVTVTCPDIPELITEGSTIDQALQAAADALVTALSVYVDDGRPLPVPSADGGLVVTPTALEIAKLGLHDAMVAGGVSNMELGRRLNTDEKAVRRLRDPLHRSHIEAVEEALHSVGRRLEVVVEDVG